MKRFTTFAFLAMALVFALSSTAAELNYTEAFDVVPEATDFSKAARDTVYLLGGPGQVNNNGTFQNAVGAADWHGFTTRDYTEMTETHWHIDTFEAVTGVNSAWCGMDFGVDGIGYGDTWNEMMEYRYTVANTALPTLVDVSANVRHNTELGYDYSYLTYYTTGGANANLVELDGNGGGVVAVTGSVTYQPGEYVDGNQIRIVWRLQSDGGYSTPTGWPGLGGFWVDDINLTVSQEGTTLVTIFDDFEDGTFGPNWEAVLPQFVGNFSKIWTNLEDYDPCLSNYGPQVAFIDDGLVVPGTGGDICQTWCYGPVGYIVTTTGGLVGDQDGHIENALLSPVMEWPDASYDGCYYFFDAFVHEDLSGDSPGIFYQWAVRSVTGTDPLAIEDALWNDRNYVYYGGPDYRTGGDAELGNLLEPGRTFVQVQASVIEYGFHWGWTLHDGYPAPYFDNFRLLAFPFVGPGTSYRSLELAQDCFPAQGFVNYADLATNSCRFDMANNVSPHDDFVLYYGDSIVINISPVREGAELTGMPVINYVIDANPVFDGVRTVATSGAVDGMLATHTIAGITDTLEGQYAFDLPDEGMLYPGDVLHYYISTEDAIGGAGGTEPQSATIPGDITEFGDFSNPNAYTEDFTVHALPTVIADGENFVTPEVLFWLDADIRSGFHDEWYLAFANLGLEHGVDYDIFYTHAPTSALGNGLGGKATLEDIQDYGTMLYTCGTSSMATMSNGDPEYGDMGTDAALVSSWLDTGNKKLFATGDELATDLAQSGSTTLLVLDHWMGNILSSNDVRPLIGGQATALVRRTGDEVTNPVFKTATSWIAYGGCPGINTFDAITPGTGAVSLAEFTNSAGVGGVYPFSAATLKVNAEKNSHVITMPYGFANIWTDPSSSSKIAASLPGRGQVMKDILDYFGVAINPPAATPAPEVVAFSTRNFPNPFNPTTKIEFTMPREGHLSLKVYNVRGELVRTLVDEVVAEGPGFKMWNGTNDNGATMSSGVYFYEARTDSDVKVQKMALVK